jgi:hypothetical protein
MRHHDQLRIYSKQRSSVARIYLPGPTRPMAYIPVLPMRRFGSANLHLHLHLHLDLQPIYSD